MDPPLFSRGGAVRIRRGHFQKTYLLLLLQTNAIECINEASPLLEGTEGRPIFAAELN